MFQAEHPDSHVKSPSWRSVSTSTLGIWSPAHTWSLASAGKVWVWPQLEDATAFCYCIISFQNQKWQQRRPGNRAATDETWFFWRTLSSKVKWSTGLTTVTGTHFLPKRIMAVALGRECACVLHSQLETGEILPIFHGCSWILLALWHINFSGTGHWSQGLRTELDLWRFVFSIFSGGVLVSHKLGLNLWCWFSLLDFWDLQVGSTRLPGFTQWI